MSSDQSNNTGYVYLVDDTQNPKPLPLVLTVDEVAQLLRVNKKTIYELFQSGDIQGGRKVGKNIRFLTQAVLSWLRGNSRVSPSRRKS